MENQSWLTNKNIVLSTGLLLASYLILLLTVTNLGQEKLEESRQSEQYLKADRYSEMLENYIRFGQRNLNEIAQDKKIDAFFSNKSAGMSMAYGLGSSLFNVKNLIQKQHYVTGEDKQPIFSRVSLLSLDGATIADSQPQLSLDINNIDLSVLTKQPRKIFIQGNKIDLTIRLSNTIYFNGAPIAILIGEFNNDCLISLLASQEYENSGSYIQLSSEQKKLVVLNSLSPAYNFQNFKGLHLQKKIKNTPLVLTFWFEEGNSKDFFTSKWFVVIISFLAVPVFFTLYYLFYISRKNTLLNTQILSTLR